MDVLAHGLWTNIMYKIIPITRRDKKTTAWGIAFGVLPDLFSFTPIFTAYFYDVLVGNIQWIKGRPDLDVFPLAGLTHTLYNFSHSFVIWVIATILILMITRKFPWIFLGWFLHIAIDLFSHSREFFATPYLYPLSNNTVNGVPWSHPVFMAINYGLLIALYLLVIPRLKKIKPVIADRPEVISSFDKQK